MTATRVAPRVSYPPELPVSARRDDLLAAIGDHQVVVVAGETGSGKTTQLPKLCLELGRGVAGQIAHTQPRRLAARTVAQRIAHELDVPLGGAVGYAVRFDDRSGEETLVRLMTDGLLLAEIQHDPKLRRYDTIIVDEAHERSLNIDFLLGHLARLLPERPDLKLIITSATIDPERFARHFGDAPVVEVSGRTYPVEVRYRPPGDGVDQTDAIADAVDDLAREAPGDVLVFLSGEREIRDTAEVLRGRLGPRVEVLPLYARLSTAEQAKVFAPHAKRRVVLATNVAETSLTVPGIRYVVDPGTARISRYSARLKVQQLPIEAVSQASADQRKGRCGRLGDGICIRLYSQDDYEARPRYTDPEILRTNLASVILQMAAANLGEIEDFPFLDPPDVRQVRDGVLLLQELRALDGRRKLTRLGRRLAGLPVDPRLGRMVLEADRLHCADEVIVIAAALSIQDPRERPQEERAAADAQHARFADGESDFLAFLNLWRHLRAQRKALSGNQFRKRCREEFLNYLRVREWQDLAGQLRHAARAAGVGINSAPAEPDAIHQALLSGLLSHVGMKDRVTRDFRGARGARFAIFPGSGLAKKPPPWVMVAELVETSRLWGRVAARIDPRWAEALAPHLIKRSYGEPRWNRTQASAVADERVTLYGLAIVEGRAVGYGRIDPAAAREMFIRRALVEGDWHTRHAFREANRRAIAEVEALEERVRRRDLLVSDEALFEFFDARVPADVVSGGHFDRWWRDARRATPDLLTLTRADLVRPDAAAAADAGRPDAWKQGDLTLRLSYVFDPGSEGDGVVVHVPLERLGQVRPAGFDWLVPALRPELVEALIRSLPKDTRRRLVPVPDVVALVVAALRPRRGTIAEQVRRELIRLKGVHVPEGAFDAAKLPAHLRMTFRVEDADGTVLGEGEDLEALKTRLRPRLRERLSSAADELERTGLTAWTIGDLPRTIALPGTGVEAYPALVDEGATAGVRVLDTPEQQALAHHAGTRRLLLLNAPDPLRFVRDRVDGTAQLVLAAAPHGSVAAVVEDATVAAADALIAAGGGPAWDEAGFRRLRDHVAGNLVDETLRAVAAILRILAARSEVLRRLEDLSGPAVQAAREDVARQVGRLVFGDFARSAGAERLADVERYLLAASRRLERLPSNVAGDRDRMSAVHELEALQRTRLDTIPKGAPLPPALVETRWLLEELRVAQFAQGLGVKGQVSAKKIRRLLSAP